MDVNKGCKHSALEVHKQEKARKDKGRNMVVHKDVGALHDSADALRRFDFVKAPPLQILL